MTSASDDLRLAADFPAASYDDWRKLVDGVLKGAPFEKLVGKSHDGLRIEPIYPRARNAAPIAGRAAAAPWQIMQRIDHPDAAKANAQALQDLENGATGLTLVFAGANGAAGYGLEPTAEAIGKVLDGVFVDAGIAIELQIGPQSRMARSTSPTISSARASRRSLRYPLRPRPGRRLRGVGIQSLCLARNRARGHRCDPAPCRERVPRAVRGCRWPGRP